MKTKCLLPGLLSLALLLPLSSFAAAPTNPYLRMDTKEVSEKTVRIQLANLQQQAAEVTLENIDGKVMYEYTIRKHNGFNMDLDLAKLPEGRYILQVKQGDTIRTQIISINNGMMLFSQIK